MDKVSSPPPETNDQALVDYSSELRKVFEEYIFQYGVISFAVVLIILVIFNSYRGRSSRFKCVRFISNKLLRMKFSSMIKRNLLQIVVWIAFTLTDLMLTYTIGINEVPDLTLVAWVVFLNYIISCDRFFLPASKPTEKHIYLDDFINLRNIYVGYLIFTTHDSVMPALLLLWILSGFKIFARLLRLFLAIRGDALVSDYMAKDHVHDNNNNNNNNDDDDDADEYSMEGYRYPLITGAGFKTFCLLDLDKTITLTIDKVWQCQGQLLSSADQKSAELKDICLSFALFNLLRRRFTGFPLYEASLPKTKDFVLRGLLSREDDLLRAFRVVDVELRFLYDFFYKKIDITFYFGFLVTLIGSIGVLVGSFWLFIYETNLASIPGFLALSIALLEIWQLCNHVCSDWTKVMLLTRYAQKTSWQNSCMTEKLIRFICNTRPIFRPVRLILGQYSLLEQSYSSIYAYTLRYGVSVKPRQGDMINLRDEVKVAVLRSLKASDGKLSNGRTSLLHNGVYGKFSWVYRLETSSEIIWVWHIATSMCEMASPHLNFHSCLQSKSFLSGDEYNLVVAVSLSRYCAYLAVFAHELLPDAQFVPLNIFKELKLESSEKLRDCKSMNEKLDKMKDMGVIGTERSSSEYNTLFMKGINLGKQLLEEILDEGERWRILADLWAELMLYLAPSDQVTAHADHLADGGEFITYIWVLLTHAGVLL